MDATRCRFDTRASTSRLAGASGPWLADARNRRYALVGTPVTRDGNPASGRYVVGAAPAADGSLACIAPSGRDMEGSLVGTDLAITCVVETAGAETNAAVVDELGAPYRLRNFTTRHVGTSSLVHPDAVTPTAVDLVRGIAWYIGEGAALNDPGGHERDEDGVYFNSEVRCHLVTVAGGVQVPAAKRPNTRSYPPPGVVDVTTPLRWQVANPYVTIANDPPLDPRGAPPVTAAFEFALGLNTLYLDAGASTGDIVRYLWDLDWTAAGTDLVTASPTAELPIVVLGTRRSGYVTLTVVGRQGQASTNRLRVEFRRRGGILQ
jgi:hypothetical protein